MQVLDSRYLCCSSHSNLKRVHAIQKTGIPGSVKRMSTGKKTEEEWRAILSPEQFRVLRKKGTEKPGTEQYKFSENGDKRTLLTFIGKMFALNIY